MISPGMSPGCRKRDPIADADAFDDAVILGSGYPKRPTGASRYLPASSQRGDVLAVSLFGNDFRNVCSLLINFFFDAHFRGR